MTIFTSTNTGIVLNDPTTQNPSTVASGATITNTTTLNSGDAVYGSNAAAWDFTNLGIINATYAGSHGIRLMAGGTITNSGMISGGTDVVFVDAAAGTVANYGTIVGTSGAAIWLNGGGLVTNSSSGLISGTGDVIFANNGLGTVVNDGTIENTGGSGDGVCLDAGGTVINSGSIQGHDHGVEINGAVGTVTNMGIIGGVYDGINIAAAVGSVANLGTIAGAISSGVNFAAGGSVDNGVSGLIAGGDSGIVIGGPGVVVNAGTVIGGNNGVQGFGSETVNNSGLIAGTNGAGVYLFNGGTLVNGQSGSASGMIAGQIGVRFSGVGSVANYGAIVGTGAGYSDGVLLEAGGAVSNFGTILGTAGGNSFGIGIAGGGIVTNGASGLILGSYAGISMGTTAGTVVNFGSIASVATSRNGVFLDAGGGVANYGTITGGPGGAAAIYARAALNVSNMASGSLVGGVDGRAAGTLVNSGTIEGTGAAAHFGASGTVTNQQSGLIQGGGGVSIGGSSSTVTNDGTIDGSSSGISIGGAFAAVYNFGEISGGAGDGVYLGAGGSITNGRTDATSASISGFDTAIRIEHATGTVANFGTITATSTAGYPGGVALLGGGNVTNMLSGVIDGQGFGVSIGTTSGTLTNFGVIRATGTGFSSGVDLGADGSVINSGTISAVGGSGQAISLNYGGSVLNAVGGLLEGSDRGVEIGGTSPAAARVTNSGTITGGSDGIVLGVADAAVTNYGTIAGSSRYGIFLTSGGIVTNASTGVIEGYKGVIATSGAATVTNLGTITGSGISAVGVDLAAAGSSLTNAGMVTGVSRGAAFTSGGYLYNEVTGTISGNPAVFGGGAVTVRNLGVINGGYRAIELHGGGSVTNGQSGGAAATIVGDNAGVLIDGGTGTVTNYGTIAATSTGAEPTGVYLFAGSVINGGPGSTAARIAGSYYGVQIYNGFGTAVTSGTVVNYGTIETTSAYGGTAVILRAAGNVVNHGAIINDHHGWGVYLGRAGSTLTNTGTIVGERYAVDLEGPNSRVIAEPGAVFSGKVYGGTVGNTLELAAGVGAGTLGGIGASTGFVGFGTVVVDASATWLLSGTNEIDAGTTLTNAGTIEVGGTLTLDGSVGNGGVIDIEPGGRLILATTITGAGGVAFAGSGGTFEIDAATMPTTPISGVTAGDQIDLRSLAWVSSSSAVFSGGTLSVTGGGGVTDTLTLSGFNSSTTRFNTADDGFGGTVVTAMAIDEWINTAGGNWNVAANWFTGAVPTAADDAVIDLAGVYLVTINTAQSVNSLTLSDAGATVTLTSTLAIGTTLNRSAGIFNLNSGGVISGGTVTGSGMVFQGGTLSGVNYQGTLDLSAGSSRLHVTNGITLSGAGGSGPATVLLTGDIGRLYFSGTESFDNAAVSIGNGGNRPFLEETGSGGTLSLGPNLAITQTGFRGEISAASGSTIVNSGTIAAGVSGGYLAISGPGTFINQGTIGVSNGDDLEIRSGTGFSNQGSLSLTGGGVLHLRNSLATADLGAITNLSGTVFIDSALNNAASVLATGSTGIGAVALTSLGVISGGTVTGSAMAFQGGTLSGVNYQGTLDLSAGSSRLHVTNGITLSGAGGSGPATVLLTGDIGRLYFSGTESFDNAAVSIGNGGNRPFLEETGSGGTLSLGPNLAITQTGFRGEISAASGSTIVNSGTIAAGVSGGYLAISGPGTFINQGTIGVSNGDDLEIRSGTGFSNQGSLSLTGGGVLHLRNSLATADLGAITNLSGTVFIDSALNNAASVLATGSAGIGAVALTSLGVISGGTVTGSAMAFQGGTLSGVNYQGTLDLSAGSSRLHVTNGITLSGAGGSGPATVLLTGDIGRLYFSGTESFDNAAVSIGNGGNRPFLEETGSGGTLSLGPNLAITQTGFRGEISAASGSTIVNSGTIAAGVSGGYLAISGPGTFINQGTIGVSNGDDLEIRSGTGFSNQGSLSLTGGGVLHLRNSLATADLGAITNLSGTVFIDSALNNAASVLATGSAGIGAVALTSLGVISGGTVTGSAMAFQGGTLSGVNYQGTLDLSAGSSRLHVTNGITLSGAGGSGPATVLLTGDIGRLYFSGTESFDNAAVSIGNGGNRPFLEETGSGGTLSLGPNLAITQTGFRGEISAASGSTIVNSGTIAAGVSGGYLAISGPGTFINQGTIGVSNGDDLEIRSGTGFSNQGSLSLTGGGVLHLRNSLATADLGAITNPGGTVFIDSALNNAASVLATGSAGIGAVALTSLGVISGGTVTGSAMAFQGGTLSGVNYQGTLDLSAGSSRLHVTNGITLSGAGGSGPATVLLTGDIGRLYFSGTESFDNAAVSIGNGGNRPFLEETGSGGTLSLGPNLAITQTGFRGEISAASGSTIVNSGTIAAGVSGGYLAISGPGTFINQGTIGVSNGDDLEIRSGTGFSNQGSLSLTGGGVLHLRNSLATADLGAITNPGGTVFIDSALNNAASVLATGSAGIGAVALTSLGVISGGTVTGSAMAFQGGTLSGVNYQGTLDLSAGSSRLHVTNGITLSGAGGSGPATVLLTGDIGRLYFSGTESFDNAAVSIGNGGNRPFLEETGSGGTLSLGPNLAITQTGFRGEISAASGSTIVNSGTIAAGVSGGYLAISGPGTFINQGTIGVSNGDDLIIRSGMGFSNQGSLSLSNGGLFAGGSSITGAGTISLASGAVASFASAVGSGQIINFIDGTDRLTLSQPGSFAGSVQGFQPGDTIDLRGVGLETTAIYSGGTLSLSGGSQPISLLLSTTATSPLFTLGTDGAGGTSLAVRSQNNFTGTYTSGIYLSNPAVQNPATVTSTGTVTNTTTAHSGDAVFGTSITAWTLTNYGTINATGAASSGVELQAGGTVTNAASAFIAGVVRGVLITGADGTVINFGQIASTQTLAGSNAIFLASGSIANFGLVSAAGSNTSAARVNGAGTVSNYGTITDTAGTAGTGVSLGSNSRLTNSGYIVGSGTGVSLFGSANVTVANSGTIAGTATGTAGGTGVNLGTNGNLANSGTILSAGANGSGVNLGTAGYLFNSGLISAYHLGVFAGTATGLGTIVNLGTIQSTQTAIPIGFVGDGILLQSGGSISNGSAINGQAVISAVDGLGISVSGGAGTIVNYGTIETTITTGTSGQAIFLGAGGTITNHGLISGERAPFIVGTATNFSAVITTNTQAAAIYNFGTIATTNIGNGINLLFGGTIVNGASNATNATITSSQNGIYAGGTLNATGTAVSNGALATIVNYGSILNSGTGSTVRLASGGTLSNRGTISGGGSGISIGGTAGGTGSVANYGTILNTGTGTSGQAVYLGGGGQVTNYGLISGAHAPGTPTRYGAVVSFHNQPGTVRNYGQITTTNVSDGVHLLAGGTLVNGAASTPGATITASHTGVYIGGSAGTPMPGAVGLVFNYGTIQSTTTNGSAVSLAAGGTVTNHGLIESARTGVAFNNTAGTVDNFGTIVSTAPLSGTRGSGVYLGAGGLITNEAGASITAVRAAVSLAFFGTTSAAATVVNSGTLTGDTGVSTGVANSGHNIIVNFGTITGLSGAGVSLYAGSTLTNAGTISGGGGTAVAFSGGGNRLIVDPGAVFGGTVAAGGAGNALELATGAGSGVLGGLGTSFTGFDSVVVDPSAVWLLSGSNTLGAGTTLANSGTLEVGASLSLGGNVVNGGVIDIEPGARLTLANGASGTGNIVFVGSGGTLEIDGAAMPANAISGFDADDSIDLPNISANAISYASGVVTLLDRSIPVAQLNLSTPYANPAFTETRDNNGGTLITVAPTPPNYTFITNFTKNNVIQTRLIKEFPSGLVTGNQGLTIPFDIEPDASGNNFYDAGGTLTINVAIPNVSHVYTLINAYLPTTGVNAATIEFIGSLGATQTFTLTDGTDIRDFYQGAFANSINGTTTQNAFTISGVQDGAGTGDVNTGAFGTYVVDEQDFALDPVFANQTLQQIVLTDLNNGPVPILLGITATVGTPFGSNLLVDPGAEAATPGPSVDSVVPIPGWTTTGNMTVNFYGETGADLDSAQGAAVNGGNNFFYGGLTSAAPSTADQIVSFGDRASAIDAGSVTATIGGYLGGFDGQDDTMSILVTFLDGNGNATGTFSIPGPSAAARGFVSELVAVSGNTVVPVGSVAADFKITATIAAGTDVDGLADNLSFVLSQVLPAPTGLALSPGSDSGVPGDNITNVTAPTITGFGVGGDTVTVFDGGTPVGSATVASDGTWSVTTSGLADGVHALVATQRDTGGNVSAASVGLSVTIDTTAPAVTAGLVDDTGASAIDAITSDPALTGTGDPNAIVTISADGGSSITVAADAGGVWSFTPVLADGPHTLSASETDIAGNTRSATVALTLDRAAPVVTISLADDTGTPGDRITSDAALTGSGDPNTFVTISEGSTFLGGATADASGVWSFTPALANGGHTVSASETDLAGNTSTQTLTLTLAGVAPGETRVLSAGESVSGITVLSGGILEIDGGAVAIGTIIGGGGTVIVGSGGVASGTVVLSGGTENVGSGGIDIGAVISGGGFEDVFGSASGTVIFGGGSQTVEVGGSAQGTLLDDAAVQTVSGFAGGTVVSATDIQLVVSGGVASGTVVSSGGSEVVQSGGQTIETTIAGGLVELQAGALAGGTTTFIGTGGVLQVDGPGMPAGPIAGFARGDTIDLFGLGFVSGNSVSFDAGSGALHVSGGVVDTLSLIGIAPGTVFAVSDDGHGGTSVREAPPAPSGLVLSPLSDSGVAGDNLTNNTTPLITGSGEAGDTVRLFDGGVDTHQSGIVAPSGGWTLVPGLGAGVHVLTAVESDGTGSSAASSPLTVTIDTSPPQAPPVSAGFPIDGAAGPIGIAVSDADDAAAGRPLAATVTHLPGNGTVTLADGLTPVTLNEALTAGQLTALLFAPATDQPVASGSFGYTVTDPAGNATAGNATLTVTPSSTVSFFDFVFTYSDGKDYYNGRVADNGTFGYQVGQQIATGAGHYDIFDREGLAAPPGVGAGSVFVVNYSHGGPGAASPTPVAFPAADGTGGLGSEQDAVRGVDGQLHNFSGTLEANFASIPLFGFVFTYADGAVFYTGTVADASGATASRVVSDGSGRVLGAYSVFSEGLTGRPSGSVTVDRVTGGDGSFIPSEAGGGSGLGSETGTIIPYGAAIGFSNQVEPVLNLGVPQPPVNPLPDPASVFASEVGEIYLEVLGRAPDAGGLAAYVAALAAGTASASMVRQTIANSAEARGLISGLYHQILGRDVDPSGLNTYIGALANGSSLPAVQLILGQSLEAQNDINQLYHDILGRPVDGGGLATYTATLANGGSLAEVRGILAHSVEAAGDLAPLFRGIVGRAPGAAELVGMEDLLANGATQSSLTSTLTLSGPAGLTGIARITALPGDSALTAPPAVPTLFNFTDLGFGHDTIAGFDPVRDTIVLPRALVANQTALDNDRRPDAAGTGTLITLNPNHSIDLLATSNATLTQANFQIL